MNSAHIHIRQLLLIITCSIFAGCPKPIPKDPNSYNFTINASLNNGAESLNVGDTLKFEVQLPDTITAKNYLGSARTEKIISVQAASYSYALYIVDTVLRTIHYLSHQKPENNINDHFKHYVSVGTTPFEIYVPYLQTTSKPYNSVLNIIPKMKGIYYLEIFCLPANYKVNQNLGGRFSIHLPGDKHLYLVGNNMDTKNWLLAADLNAANGSSDVYAFRVR